jgi:hypothetical protein
MSSWSSRETVRVAAGERITPPQCCRICSRRAIPKRQSFDPVSRLTSFWFISHIPNFTLSLVGTAASVSEPEPEPDESESPWPRRSSDQASWLWSPAEAATE